MDLSCLSFSHHGMMGSEFWGAPSAGTRTLSSAQRSKARAASRGSWHPHLLKLRMHNVCTIYPSSYLQILVTCPYFFNAMPVCHLFEARLNYHVVFFSIAMLNYAWKNPHWSSEIKWTSIWTTSFSQNQDDEGHIRHTSFKMNKCWHWHEWTNIYTYMYMYIFICIYVHILHI